MTMMLYFTEPVSPVTRPAPFFDRFARRGNVRHAEG
jgi:hypothetical protein